MLKTVWEVYEQNSLRCVMFNDESAARNQTVISNVDQVSSAVVALSDDEVIRLESGDHLWG